MRRGRGWEGRKAAGCGFYNTRRLDFPKPQADLDNVAANLMSLVHGASAPMNCRLR
jgi:hypothetical protein